MPSRQLPSTPAPAPPLKVHHTSSPIATPVAAGAAAVSFIIFLTVLYRKLSRKKTAPSDQKLPHRFSYRQLRCATSSFAPSNKLGQGGFGSVYRGTLASGQEVAVKLMDSGSLQGEREFQNELSLAGKMDSDSVVSLLGFCSDRSRRLLLVYELMQNGSLQDALLVRKCPEVMVWKRRFAIAFDIARGLEFLHSCDPPIIHGDIKPSNVLLDQDFSAKIADFGLARVKIDSNEVEEIEIEIESTEKIDGSKKRQKGGLDTDGEEDKLNGNFVAGKSPESFARVLESETSPEASTSEILEKTRVSEGYLDRLSIDSGSRRGCRKKRFSGKDWWWRQDNSGSNSDSGSRGVKDYVMEWIGTEIEKERPKKSSSHWIATSASAAADEESKTAENSDRKRQHRRLEWWASLDENRLRKKEKIHTSKEWWKEEFCEELSNKKKKKKSSRSSRSNTTNNWCTATEQRISCQRNSGDWASGEIPKSSGLSSTPSMRGTVCYIAPEYSWGGILSEKCDVYSFGVLLLVLVSGRRPLQVMASPLSEIERANLVSWARHLAHTGKLLDLVDRDLNQDLNRDQALICVTVALLCLQRSPAHRPGIKEVVAMLSGDLETPHFPVEFSPSPPLGISFRNKAR